MPVWRLLQAVHCPPSLSLPLNVEVDCMQQFVILIYHEVDNESACLTLTAAKWVWQGRSPERRWANDALAYQLEVKTARQSFLFSRRFNNNKTKTGDQNDVHPASSEDRHWRPSDPKPFLSLLTCLSKPPRALNS